MDIDIKQNFWKIYESSKEVPVFREFIEEYGEEKTSIIMWGLSLGKHPDGDIFKAIDEDEEREVAINRFLFSKNIDTIDFKSIYYKSVVKTFEKVFIPIHRLALIKMDKSLREYINELDSKKMDSEKVKFLKAFNDITEIYNIAKMKFEATEKSINTIKGGGILTAAQDPMSLFDENDFK